MHDALSRFRYIYFCQYGSLDPGAQQLCEVGWYNLGITPRAVSLVREEHASPGRVYGQEEYGPFSQDKYNVTGGSLEGVRDTFALKCSAGFGDGCFYRQIVHGTDLDDVGDIVKDYAFSL
jgi:hypothetical protein